MREEFRLSGPSRLKSRSVLSQQGEVQDRVQGEVWQAICDMGWAKPHPDDLVLRAVTQPSLLPALVLGLQGADVPPQDGGRPRLWDAAIDVAG